MKFILGKKLDMTQLWLNDERRAVTRVAVGPCVVTQVKTVEADGYEAVQLGFGKKSVKNIAKPQRGHCRNFGNFRWLREFRLKQTDPAAAALKIGDRIDISAWAIGDKVTAQGTTKGRGFAGVVKRHGFHGHNATHGTKDQERMPGSIGSGGVQHVFKGTRMGGRMGGKPMTQASLEILKIDAESGIVYLSGAVAGSRNGLLKLFGPGDIQAAVKQSAEAIEPSVIEPAAGESSIETIVTPESAATVASPADDKIQQ